MPYAVSSMTRPGSLLVGGIGNCAARAAPPAASAPPVSAAVLRRKFLRLRTTESRSGLFDIGLLPCLPGRCRICNLVSAEKFGVLQGRRPLFRFADTCAVLQLDGLDAAALRRLRQRLRPRAH